MSPLREPTAVSYLFSASLHLSLLALVLWQTAPIWVQTVGNAPHVQTTVAERADEPTDDAVEWDVNVPETDQGEAAESANRTNVDAPPSAASLGLGEFARQRLEQARQTAGEKSSEEQLGELESLGKRLGQVSSEESVQELSDTLSMWLGTNERATQPTETGGIETGEFDVDTAQISDVKKIESETGVSYVAVLVDAQGNSMESLLDDVDGPQLYETFQLMKKFPLLEAVYRGTVMGLLDKLATDAGGLTQNPDAESPKANE